MRSLVECQLCKKVVEMESVGEPQGLGVLPRHYCGADPNRYGFCLAVGTVLEPGDDLYIPPKAAEEVDGGSATGS